MEKVHPGLARLRELVPHTKTRYKFVHDLCMYPWSYVTIRRLFAQEGVKVTAADVRLIDSFIQSI